MSLDVRGNDPLLEVRDLKKYYPQEGQRLPTGPDQVVKAVDGISFTIDAGETLGLVGESGCGKSTTGRCVLRLVEPTSGQVCFGGRDILTLNRREVRALRREMQIIFQDPYSSLNPRMTVAQIIEEPLIIHGMGSKASRLGRVADLVRLVGLSPDQIRRYPHEFSGGQRQRIGIARALALNPKLIVCDEPVSALDVSVQAQIVNLLQDLQDQLGLAYLFISHGLAVVRHLARRVGIMYAGKLVEIGSAGDIFSNPIHPYTKLLLSAIPNPDPEKRRPRNPNAAKTHSAQATLPGCGFQPRCPIAESSCSESEPPLVEVSPGHFAACFVATAHAEQAGQLRP